MGDSVQVKIEYEKLEGVPLPSLLGGPSPNKEASYASYWVGAAWTDDSPAQQVVIVPKFDFLKAGLMLADVLGSEGGFPCKTEGRILELRADGDDREPLLRADPSGDRIELPPNFPADQFLLVQLVAFVNALSEMLERRKRMDRTPLCRSFTGEIRGRLNIARSIQKHWAGGEGHKVVCDLTEPSANIPLNQTLLEALVRSEAFLNNTEKTGEALNHVEHKARRARALLHGVERLRDTSSRHLAKIRSTLRGYYAGFRPIFDLACCIVRNERFVIQPEKDIKPEIPGKPEKSMTVPFGVNMDALFELYVRACVEKINEVSLEPATNRIVWKCQSSDKQTLPKRGPDIPHQCDALGVEVRDTPTLPKRRPDIVGKKDGKRFIVEVKYYSEDWLETLQDDEKAVVEGYARPREGFFQIVSYMHLFGAGIGVVVFPSSQDCVIEGCLGIEGVSAGKLNFVSVGKDYTQNLKSNLKQALNALSAS